MKPVLAAFAANTIFIFASVALLDDCTVRGIILAVKSFGFNLICGLPNREFADL